MTGEAYPARKRILIFSHAVTMAHFTRPLKVIEQLDPKLYEIFLASHEDFRKFTPANVAAFINIQCIDANKFSDIVGNARPIYDSTTYEKHIEEDIAVMELVKPDLVIGDFRHSLSVSCRLQRIKYVNIANAYWSPDIKLNYPLPEAPVIRTLGEKLASIVVKSFLPIVLRFNFFKMAYLLRKSLRKAGLHFTDYRQVITDGDATLYCDTPELVPLKHQLRNETFVGPLVWSMNVSLPTWWSELDPNKKRIFLTLGSSGPADSLPLIITALSKLDVEVIVALAGKKLELPPLANVHVTNYLPIEEACANSDLIICNGGSPMCHAALMFGVPTIGIVCNNDQLLNMAHIQKRGAGLMLRYWNLTAKKMTDAVTEILGNSTYAKTSQTIKSEFAATNTAGKIEDVIQNLLSGV